MTGWPSMASEQDLQLNNLEVTGEISVFPWETPRGSPENLSTCKVLYVHFPPTQVLDSIEIANYLCSYLPSWSLYVTS